MFEKTAWERFFDAHASIYENNVFTKNTVPEVDFLLDELHPTLTDPRTFRGVAVSRFTQLRGVCGQISSYMDSAISVDIMGSRCYSSAHVPAGE